VSGFKGTWFLPMDFHKKCPNIKFHGNLSSGIRAGTCRQTDEHDEAIRGVDKSLDRPDWKKQLEGRHFSSGAEVIAAAETWLDGQSSELFLSGLQKLEFGRCNLFPYWSG